MEAPVGISAILKIGNANSGRYRRGSGKKPMASELRLRKFFGENLSVKDTDQPEVISNLEYAAKFSDQALKSLADDGVKLYFGKGSVCNLDDNAKWRNYHPSGWPEGSTYEQINGCYDYEKKEVSVGTGLTGSACLPAHEVGHAIFHTIVPMETVNKIEEFNKKHLNEILNNYFTQPQKIDIRGQMISVGANEMFADSVARIIRYGRLAGGNWLLNQDACTELEHIIRGAKVI